MRTLDEIEWDTWIAKAPATLVFVIQDNQILLIRKKRGLGAGKINGPGGKLDPGETPIACAIRETQEEIGITPENLQQLGELRFQFTDGYSTHVHVFRSNSFAGTPIETAEAIPYWFPIEPRSHMKKCGKMIASGYPLLIRSTPFKGRFLFDDDTMLDYKLESVVL